MKWPQGHQAEKAFTTRRATGTPLGLNRSPNSDETDEWIGLGPIPEVSREFVPLDGCALSEGESPLVFSLSVLFPLFPVAGNMSHIDFLAFYSRFLPLVGRGG